MKIFKNLVVFFVMLVFSYYLNAEIVDEQGYQRCKQIITAEWVVKDGPSLSEENINFMCENAIGGKLLDCIEGQKKTGQLLEATLEFCSSVFN